MTNRPLDAQRFDSATVRVDFSCLLLKFLTCSPQLLQLSPVGWYVFSGKSLRSALIARKSVSKRNTLLALPPVSDHEQVHGRTLIDILNRRLSLSLRLVGHSFDVFCFKSNESSKVLVPLLVL